MSDQADVSPRVPEDTALMTPDEWCKQFSVTVHGPDGWRRDGKSWDDPIAEAEFWERVAVSSCEMPVRRHGDKPIAYAGPTGRERPGEHWNARIIREQAEAAVADRCPDTHITEDMIAKGADGIRDLLTILGVDPDELTEHNDAPTVAAQLAESVLQAGLAGCPVVELPTLDADGDCLIGEELDVGAVGVINVDDGAYEVGLYLDGVGFGLKPDRARRIAAAILAAVARGDERVAPDRLAGSVSPKGDNTNDE